MKIRDKVLIVEDEQNIKNFMSTILAANGFDTLMAGSAKEALSMISSHCPDLIILDLGLPDMDGMEVLKQVRAWSSVPVIVVSARTHEGDKVAALDLGATETQAFFKVLLPAISPGILSGFLMAFTLSIDDFVISYYTTGADFVTLPLKIYAMTKKTVKPDMYALSTIIFVTVLMLLMCINLMQFKAEKKSRRAPHK
mgnify:FL=1